MAYVNSTYYKSTYEGTLIPDAQLNQYLQRASDGIDELTYFSISSKTGGFSGLTTFQQRQVSMAVCFQADHLFNYGDMPSVSLEGFKAGDNQVTFGKNSDLRYSRIALDYLQSTNLMYRGLA